ncbi:nuclear transport factor 2 family protein [Blastomonas sp. AAP53]|uniref:YybH family protein n=1 Tax=Blastomonas sp. AAP53 TaxID=1248760 RepID=UPI0002D42746|nr:nuclear transport factor 2 family protein [Blastomonas sp. AAP53]
MRSERITLAALFLTPCVAFAQAPTPEAEIRNVIADMQAAWNRGDFEGYMRGFQSPGVVFVSRGQFQDDWQGTLDHYVRDYGGAPERRGALHFYDIEVEMLSDDAAQLISRYHLDRADSPQYGINTRLMRRVGGRWVIALNHVSSTATPDPNDPVAAHRP